MRPRILNFLRCPECQSPLSLRQKLEASPADPPTARTVPCTIHASAAPGEPCRECWGEEIHRGILECAAGHRYAVLDGIPWMEPGSLQRFRDAFLAEKELDPGIRAELGGAGGPVSNELFDGTRASFSLEWDMWKPGDRTWIWNLEQRRELFREEVGLGPEDETEPRVVLDAGCGNGQLSAIMATLGLEVCAVDLSSGPRNAHRLKESVAAGNAPLVHYLQGNLASPPFEPRTFDIVYSSGVLHHTPNTERTFRRVFPLTKPEGRGYVWLYCSKRKRVKRVVTAVLRVFTVRMPPALLRKLCFAIAAPVNWVTGVLTVLRIRNTPPRTAREMAVSLFDEFSPRYQYHHDEEQVEGWFTSLGFAGFELCNVDRNGFGLRAIRSGGPG